MKNFNSARNVREEMSAQGLKFNKAFGQNFLTDETVLEKIVEAADLNKESCVLEIGPGMGVLTVRLAEQAGNVVTVEIDKNLIAPLNENLSKFSNVEIINEDILKVDLKTLFEEKFSGKSVKVVANLPYYITTPIIMKLLEERLNITEIVIMIQKEVADRLTAAAGKKEYGAISVSVNYFSEPKKIVDVPPHAFVPQPKVWSQVIKLSVYSEPPVKVKDEKKFFALIKGAFGQRRKTLVNAAGNYPPLCTDKEKVKKALAEMGLSENVRGEALSLQEFAELSDLL